MKNGKAARALEHLDDALITEAMNESDFSGENLVARRRKAMKNNNWKKWGALVAVLAIVLVSALSVGPFVGGITAATIALDVNPSIELEINRREAVVEVRTLNDAARTVVGDMNFKNVDLDVAVNAIIGSMLKHGYLSTDQNSILVSVSSRDEAKADSLKNKISKEIDLLLGGSDVSASVITQSFEKNSATGEIARENSISDAKATLVSKIVASGLADARGNLYTAEVLAGLNVNELKLILESKAASVLGINTSGTASGNKYISEAKAVELALADAGFTSGEVRRVEVDMDFDGFHGVMVFEVEFIAGDKDYEYELKAATGEILEKFAEKADREDLIPEATAPATTTATETAPESTAASTGEQVSPASTEFISRENALALALADANVNAEAVVGKAEIEADMERGMYVYEIEFATADTEYDYTVNAKTGEIIKREIEIDHRPQTTAPPQTEAQTNSTPPQTEAPPQTQPPTTTTADYISRDYALRIAVSDAGVNLADVRHYEVEFDFEKGIYVYEVDFETAAMEYEYTVNADTGAILHRESERND